MNSSIMSKKWLEILEVSLLFIKVVYMYLLPVTVPWIICCATGIQMWNKKLRLSSWMQTSWNNDTASEASATVVCYLLLVLSCWQPQTARTEVILERSNLKSQPTSVRIVKVLESYWNAFSECRWNGFWSVRLWSFRYAFGRLLKTLLCLNTKLFSFVTLFCGRRYGHS